MVKVVKNITKNMVKGKEITKDMGALLAAVAVVLVPGLPASSGTG